MQNNNYNKYFFLFTSLNICLIPFFLITGPFLPDLSLTICSLSYFFYILLNKQLNVFRNFFFIFFIIFYIVILISSFLSGNILFSLHSSLPYLRFGFFVMCVWHTAQEDKNLFNKIFIVLTIIFFLLILDGYLQFFTGTNILNYEKMGVRVSSFFGDRLILGSYVIRFFPIYLGMYFFLNRKKLISLHKNIFFILFLVLISVLVIISGERTAFGLLLLSILLMFFFLHGLKKIKIIILIFFTIANLIFISIYQSNFHRLVVETKEQIITEEKIYFFGSRRHEYAAVSINIFKENILLGSGPRTYRINSNDQKYKISELSWNTHPHSIYFQLLAETGILGALLIFSAFCYFVIFLFRETFNKFQNNNLSKLNSNIKICITISIIINFFPLIPSGNFFNNWMSIIYFYPISLFFAFTHKLNLRN